MTFFNERIRRGEAAIARAKAMDRDVAHWEQHLEQLKAVIGCQPVIDPTEGRIIAVEICSEVLQAHIWLAFDISFDRKDGQAVFYADEIPLLKNKTAEQLREIHKIKLAFGPGSWVRDSEANRSQGKMEQEGDAKIGNHDVTDKANKINETKKRKTKRQRL